MKKFFMVILAVLIASIINVVVIATKDRVYLETVHDSTKKVVKEHPSFPLTKEKIPSDLVWQDGSNEKNFADPKAVKGGTQRSAFGSFPATFRQVGPQSNGGFRGVLQDMDPDLVEIHPETGNHIPALAKEWAISKDRRTAYYRIDPDARWSDGEPVTADDFVYRLKAMRSPGIVAPWYNQYYSTQITEILKFDDLTIGIRLSAPNAEPLIYTALEPLPYHFYGKMRIIKKKYTLSKAIAYLKRDNKEVPAEILAKKEKFDLAMKAYQESPDGKEKPKEEKLEIEVEDVEENWIRKNDWAIPPRTGPYNIHSFIKGKEIVLSRVQNWWAKDKKFYKGRYNVDKIHYAVIRDFHITYQHFLKGNLDAFGLILPNFWHSKAKYLDQVDKGYMTKIWYYDNKPQNSSQLSFNMDNEQLKNRDLRIGLMHAINLQEMIDTVLRGDYSIAENFNVGQGIYSHPTIKARRFDPKKAVEHLTKAGYSKIGDDGIRQKEDGTRLSFKILYASSAHTERLLVIQSEARKLGVEFILDQFDAVAVFKAMADKKHQIAWHGWGATARPQYRGQFHKENAHKPKNNNFSNLDDDKVSELIDQYRNAMDTKIKMKLAHQIEERLYELAPAMPTYIVPYFRMATWRWVKYPEWIATSSSESVIDKYGLFWIDDEVRKETLKAMKEGKIFYDTPKLIKMTRENGKTKKTVQ